MKVVAAARWARVVRPWQVMLLAGLALTAGYFALPGGSVVQSVYNNALSLVFVGAILLGIRLNQPTDRSAWFLFAFGTFLSVGGDSVSTAYIAASGEAPFPSVADVLYLAAYPFLFAAVARLNRGAAGYGVRERRLDALIVALGALVFTWQPLLHAYASDNTLSWLGKSTLIAYPVMDIALLYVLLCAVVFARRRTAAGLLIGLSLVIMMVGDFAYDFLELNGAYNNGDLIDATWILSYLLLAVAALHPSMAQGQGRTATTTPRIWWLVIVAVASFVPTTYLLVGTAFHKNIDLVPLAGLAVVMAVLATTRMAWMFQVLRERAGQLQTRSEQLQSRTASLQEALRERDQLETDLRHQAFHDPLTGLANRALLGERIEQALARSIRDQGLIALVMSDIDGFKTVNDSLGHQTGDALLVAAAERLCAVVRPGDTVARLGGDEFAILLDGVRDAEVANKVAERIVTVLREPAEVGGDTVTVSASVGITIGTAASTAAGLVSDADAAMYEAKTQGKNRYVVFDPAMRSRAMERLRLTTAFPGAIERDEFYLDYQPCFSLADGRLESFEALVRWQHPELGIVAPLRFIPLAEESGFILDLGRWVLETACRQAMTWPTTGEGVPTLAVNVSASQLNNPDFAEHVRDALQASGLPGARLVLEVTESMLIDDKLRTVGVLNELKGLGVRVAIDDFGVGYSSLSQLRSLPVDFVKIDKSFVDQLCDDRSDHAARAEGRAVVEAILRLATDLELTTVAEGIEVTAQRDTLAEMGCHSGQGFLLSYPLNSNAATALAFRSNADARALPQPTPPMLTAS